jgi:uncharacterized membrane protein
MGPSERWCISDQRVSRPEGVAAVKNPGKFVVATLVSGILVIAPVYLATLLVLRVAKSMADLMKPIAAILPKGYASESVLSVLVVLVAVFLIGLLVRSPRGLEFWDWLGRSLFEKLPGYGLFRSLTQRLAGDTTDEVWKPALAEIEEALVPAFIIEALPDGRFTVFVPAVPTPMVGTTYILTPDRVHPVNVPFAHAVKAISRWGSGCQELIAAMESKATAA